MLRTTALITGCSRGLGLEMVKQLCQSGWKFKHKKIIATCRYGWEGGGWDRVSLAPSNTW